MAGVSRRHLLFAGAALAACRPTPAMIAAEPPAARSAAGTMVEVDGVAIHLARSGRGRPVCLLHGASGNLNDMTFRLAPALAERYEVIAMDRPGLGLSGAPAGGAVSIRAQAALLRAALSRTGVGCPILVGHSFGGSVALAWAVDAPDSIDGLVLLAAPSEIWEGGVGAGNQLLANPVTGPALARAVPKLVTQGFAENALQTLFAPQDVPGGYLDHIDLGLVLQPSSLRENARQLVALKQELRGLIPAYPGLAMPIELLHGEADRTVGLEIHSARFARQVPHSRLTRLPGVGHMLHQVETARVVERIDAVA